MATFALVGRVGFSCGRSRVGMLKMMEKSRRLKNILNRSDTVSRGFDWGSTIAESSPFLLERKGDEICPTSFCRI
jgi:hypothetical protein